MKKSALFLAALIAVLGVGFVTMTQVSYAEEAASSVLCPKCNSEIHTGDKPVVSMLAGKTHNCPACKKDFTVAADQNAAVCAECAAEIVTCPACGTADALPQS